MMAEERIVRIPCTVEGHEEDWIEFDTGGWGLADFDLLMGQYPLKAGLGYVKRDSVAWHVTGTNGPVNHPGRGASAVAWRSAFKQIGPEGLRLASWMGEVPALALLEAVRISRKSAQSNTGGSAESEQEPSG